jgi:hypothetical protein
MIYTRDDIPYLIGLHFELNPNLFAKGWIEPEDLETIYTIEGLIDGGERVQLSWLEDGQKQYTSTEIDDELLRFLNDESWLITDLPTIDTTNIFEGEDEFEWARKATNIYKPKVGDVFDVPGADNTKLKVHQIIYSKNFEPKETLADRGGQWGKIKYIHTGCDIWLERYNESTGSWGTVGTPTDLGWIQYLINIGWWFPVKDSMNEQEDDLQWAKDLVSDISNVNDVVIVTNKGQQYTSYLGAMASLDVPGAKERLRNSRNDQDWHDNCLEMKEKGILDDAYNGDICYLMSGSYEGIHHLVRIKDKKHFILYKTGFEHYKDTLTEQEDEFEWARDLIKQPIMALIVNQVYRVNTHGRMEIMITRMSHETIYYISKVDTSTDPSLDKYQDRLGNTRVNNGEKLIRESYWVPIPIEDSLFSPKYLKESEEDEFEWARDIIKQPINALVVGQTYRVKLPEEEKGIIDLMITEMDAISFRDNSRAIIFDPETSSLDSQGQREFLKDYNRTGDRTEVSHGKYLLKIGHWYPIPIEDSLFKNENLNESDDLDWARNLKPNLNDKQVLIDFMRDMLKEYGYELSLTYHRGIRYWGIRMKSRSGVLYAFPEDKLSPRYVKQRLEQHNDEFPTPESFTWSPLNSREHYYNVYKELEKILRNLTE